jgi:hypothetical protein
LTSYLSFLLQQRKDRLDHLQLIAKAVVFRIVALDVPVQPDDALACRVEPNSLGVERDFFKFLKKLFVASEAGKQEVKRL